MLACLPSDQLVAGDGLETQIRRVRVGDGHVLVSRLMNGEVIAFSPVCPHQFTELDEATIRDGNLRCPRHGYIYDARTGENVHPGRDTPPENRWKVRPGFLPCYPVVEDDGWIWVSDEMQAPPPSYDASLEARPSAADAPLDLAGPSLAGPSPAAPPAPAPPGELGAVEQSVKFLTVSADAPFEIRLPFVPRPGFGWRFELVGELLSVIEEQFETGYSPCQRLTVAARGVGAATLSCIYADEGDQRAEVRTFIVRIQG